MRPAQTCPAVCTAWPLHPLNGPGRILRAGISNDHELQSELAQFRHTLVRCFTNSRFGMDALMIDTPIRVRVADVLDASRLAEIYAPHVLDSHTSFETEAPDAHEMTARLARVLATYPWLVAERGGRVVGYAYGTEHRARRAYRWSVETTVYLDADACGLGIGRHLYSVLFELLRRQGFIRVFGGIALPNEASVRMHRALGFEPIGIFPKVGYKNGRWVDVAWLGRSLCEPTSEPGEPIAFANLDRNEVAAWICVASSPVSMS